MPAVGSREGVAEGHPLATQEGKATKKDDALGTSSDLNIKGLREALERMMTCSDIFCKKRTYFMILL